jgi:hypothetical protein
MALSIFHVREVAGSRRELILRAHSSSDAAVLTASACDVSVGDAGNRDCFVIAEVNYGDEFLNGGPRGVIVTF